MADPKNAPLTGEAAERRMRMLSRRSFLTGGLAAVAGIGAWTWLTTAAHEQGIPWPLRRMLRFNQRLGEGFASLHNLAPTFAAESVQNPPRTNGEIGLDGAVDAAAWCLRIQHAGRAAEQSLTLAALRALPRADLVTELKCVEGWSQVMRFGGVTFHDFLTRFGLGTRSGRAPDPDGDSADLYRYVYLATPDESYYVGLDLAAALHPQTLLCDTMNGQALNREHGAPLRIYLAAKYG